MDQLFGPIFVDRYLWTNIRTIFWTNIFRDIIWANNFEGALFWTSFWSFFSKNSKIHFSDTICSVIQNRLDNNNEPDDPLKGCWSCLWNVTDETPSNSERFIENGGVELFLKCLKKFPNDTDLKRNIMGLVGNIAEVASLRKYLIRDETVRFYSEALQSEGLEVAYNACGTLSHILSDESSTWPESLLEMKKDMTQKMIQAVESWDESAERNINYRSLKPGYLHFRRSNSMVF